jgi:hypothetical protein
VFAIVDAALAAFLSPPSQEAARCAYSRAVLTGLDRRAERLERDSPSGRTPGRSFAIPTMTALLNGSRPHQALGRGTKRWS